MQCACVILSSVACLAVLYHIIPHYLINDTTFEKKLLNIKRVFRFSLQLLSETFLILRIERDMIKIIYWSSCKVPVVLVRFQWNLNLFDGYSKNIQIWNFIKIRRVGAELLHAAGQKCRHDEANSRFSQFPNALRVQVTWLAWEKGDNNVLIETSEADNSQDLCSIKMVLMKLDGRVWIRFICLWIATVGSPCEYDNELPVPQNAGKFFDQLTSANFLRLIPLNISSTLKPLSLV